MQIFKCIICEREIKAIHFDSIPPDKPSQGMWNDGVVELLYMPYGSRLDGEVYVIGICDNCIEEKFKKGIIGKKLDNYIK